MTININVCCVRVIIGIIHPLVRSGDINEPVISTDIIHYIHIYLALEGKRVYLTHNKVADTLFLTSLKAYYILPLIKAVCIYTPAQNQNAVSAYFTSKQISGTAFWL